MPRLRDGGGEVQEHRRRPPSCRRCRSRRAASPSRRLGRLSAIGTVSRCPASSTRRSRFEFGAGEHGARRGTSATVAAPQRRFHRVGERPLVAETLGPSTSAAVSATGSAVRSRAGAGGPQRAQAALPPPPTPRCHRSDGPHAAQPAQGGRRPPPDPAPPLTRTRAPPGCRLRACPIPPPPRRAPRPTPRRPPLRAAEPRQAQPGGGGAPARSTHPTPSTRPDPNRPAAPPTPARRANPGVKNLGACSRALSQTVPVPQVHREGPTGVGSSTVAVWTSNSSGAPAAPEASGRRILRRRPAPLPPPPRTQRDAPTPRRSAKA